MDLSGRHVLVVGLGASGRAAVRLAHRHGAKVAASDAGHSEALEAASMAVAPLVETCELGVHTPELFDWAELIVASPGVPLASPALDRARRRGVPIIGEVELASRFLPVPLIGITGTNGKSTTTALLGEMMVAAGRRAFVGGNLGTPLAEAALQSPLPEIVVAELSSFQLETIDRLRPDVALLLNLSPDHQNRYADFAAYVRAKGRLFLNQLPSDAVVLNAGDSRVMQFAGQVHGRVHTFGRFGAHARCEGDMLLLHTAAVQAHIPLVGFRLLGPHNRENLAAAALAAALCDVPAEAIAAAVESFSGLAHRLEDLGVHDGVRYVNDSKATTPDAVRTALVAMDRPVVLILGGRDKGADWSTLGLDTLPRCRAVVAYGEAADVIATNLGVGEPRIVDRFRDALELARGMARPGDVVLLSPGCASFDQFDNFEQRGIFMREWVRSRWG